MDGSNALTTLQWRGTVALFVTYALFGILLGLLAALLLPGYDYQNRRLRKLLVLSVVVVYGMHGLHSLDPHALPALAAAAVSALAVIGDVGGTPGRQGVAAQSMLVSFALIFSSAATTEYAESWFFGIVVALTTAVLVIGINTPVRFLLSRLGSRMTLSPAWRDASVAVLIVGLVFGPDLLSSSPKFDAVVHAATVSGRPNIVLITMDTVRADHMGVYGYHRANTPHLQALARNATLYSNFIAASSITLTSHASIFTGLYPQSHGAYRISPDFTKGRPLPDTIPTVTTSLASAGYRTMAVIANRYYLRSEWGMTRGFQIFNMGFPAVLISTNRPFLLRNSLRRHLLTFDGVSQDLDTYTWGADLINRNAFDLLDQADRQTPFFLFLNYMDAHEPYVVPPPYNRLYPGRDSSFTGADYWPVEHEVDDLGMPLNPRLRNHFNSQYDAAIAYLDEHLGRLVAELKRRGLYDNTLLIITSDHGEALGEQGFVGHDVSTSQSQVHIPLIVKYPHQTAGERVDTLASHVDLMPTMLDVAGVQVPQGVEGISLLNSKAETGRAIVAECHSNLNGGSHFRRAEYALFFGTKKLVYSPESPSALYDLALDPGEEHNLYSQADPTAVMLGAKLEQWSLHTVPHYTKGQFPVGKTVKTLQSLGYAR